MQIKNFIKWTLADFKSTLKKLQELPDLTVWK